MDIRLTIQKSQTINVIIKENLISEEFCIQIQKNHIHHQYGDFIFMHNSALNNFLQDKAMSLSLLIFLDNYMTGFFRTHQSEQWKLNRNGRSFHAHFKMDYYQSFTIETEERRMSTH